MEIGGYLELELPQLNNPYHPNAIGLNTGRNCFEYILISNKISHIFIPYYLCDVLLEPLIRNNISYSYYSIDNNFLPCNIEAGKKWVLYLNYFGICDQNLSKIYNDYENIVIDNSHAFYTMPQKDIDTFYSPRKFFGIPDGGYVYPKEKLSDDFKKDVSIQRMDYLLRRIEFSAQAGYLEFRKVAKELSNLPIMKMSNLTAYLLKNIQYEHARIQRKQNFIFLHTELAKYNEIKISENFDSLNPLCYPLLIKQGNIKEKLIKEKIYLPTYWESVKKNVSTESFEYILSERMLALPIDQRYNIDQMRFIVNTLKDIL